jgi:hypothetical protein
MAVRSSSATLGVLCGYVARQFIPNGLTFIH